MIGFGKIFLGSISLGRIGRLSKSGASLPLYKQILSKMPKELKESLVCWYSPNLQGLTNAELYNSDNLYVGGLHDLSCNGHDMDLHGFDGIEGGGHVDEEGDLCFDGLNDYGIIDTNNGLTEYTLFYDRKVILGEAVGVVIGSFKASQTNSDLTLFDCASVSQQYNTRGKVITNVGWKEDGLMIATYDYVEFDNIRTNINNPSSKRPLSGICIASQIVGNTKKYIAKEVCRNLVWFSRTLTDTETDWVKTNMLVSQEVSKRNVTLWLVDEESGSFDKFKSMEVQNGNMIGKYDEEGNLVLPVYDIGSIYQTSLQWYTDADCTEEYSGEYITEDTFLYAKKVRTSDNMLAQLDNVVLEDGTTAREHLVCWYSPKLEGLTKESVLTDATLADLSGNGYDMDLYGFTEDETIIDADGALMFDGVNDYGVCMLNNNSQYTDIALMTDYNLIGSKYAVSMTGYTTMQNRNILIQRSSGHSIRYVNNIEVKIKTTTDGVVYVDSYRVDDIPITTTPLQWSDYLFIARLRNNNNDYNEMVLRTLLLFDTSLTTDEEIKVKTILKLQ